MQDTTQGADEPDLPLAALRCQLLDLARERGHRCTARVAAALADRAEADGKPRLQVAMLYFSAEIERLADDHPAARVLAQRGRDLAIELDDDEVVELYDELVAELREPT